jgi:hypothetical protein
MAYLTLTSLVLVIMGHLSLVFIMLTPYYKTGTIVLLVVTVTNVVFILKILHILLRLSGLLRDASREARKRGQDNQIMSGGKVL